MLKPFFGAFFGKIAGALFVALCITFGFGPDQWVIWMLADLPALITPEIARTIFILLGASVLVAISWTPAANLLRRVFRPNREPEYIGLNEAVMGAWERIRTLPEFDTQPSQSPEFSSRRDYNERDPAKLPGIAAQIIFNSADPPIPIRGTYPPRKAMEVIPANRVAGYGFSDDATELFDWIDQAKPPEQRRRYINLQVRQADIERRIRDMGGG